MFIKCLSQIVFKWRNKVMGWNNNALLINSLFFSENVSWKFHINLFIAIKLKFEHLFIHATVKSYKLIIILKKNFFDIYSQKSWRLISVVSLHDFCFSLVHRVILRKVYDNNVVRDARTTDPPLRYRWESRSIS